MVLNMNHTNFYDEVRKIGGYNLVLLTKDFDEDGYDKFLRNNVK